MTSADLLHRAQNGVVDDTENPSARPKRRTFTTAQKLAYLHEYEARQKGTSERGAFLRRTGLYSSHLTEWRTQRDKGNLDGTAQTRKRQRTAEQTELAKLRRRNKALETELERTKTALEITGKVHALLELVSESADTEPRSTK